MSLHLTFPLISNFHIVLWVMHQDHVSRLSAWVSPVVRPYLPSYVFLLLFGWQPSLLDPSLSHCGVWPSLRLAYSEYRPPSETSLGLSCSTCVRCNWGGCLLYCGRGVSFPVISAPTGTVAPFIVVSAIYDDRDVTQPHQRFICIHPSSFPLAWLPLSARSFLRRYPSLPTPPLPVTQGGIGDSPGY